MGVDPDHVQDSVGAGRSPAVTSRAVALAKVGATAMRLNSMPPPDRQVTKPIVLRHRVRARFWMPLLVVLGCVAETPEPGGISTWTIGSEPVVTIGSIDGEAPYLLSGIQAVELLPDDRIAVIDGSSQTIRIYDASG